MEESRSWRTEVPGGNQNGTLEKTFPEGFLTPETGDLSSNHEIQRRD